MMGTMMSQVTQHMSQTVAQHLSQHLTPMSQHMIQVLEETRRRTPNEGPSNKGHGGMHKHFSRVEKCGGKETQWKEWCFQVSMALNAFDTKGGELMDKVEKSDMKEANTGMVEVELEDHEENIMEKTKGELYSMLSVLTTDEANVIVRSIEDKNGYVAWKKLYDRYNPRTPASLTQAWLEVVNPRRTKDLREAGRAIDVWEQKVAVLKKEHGEEPTVGLKAAVLFKMLPENVHLTIAQGMDSTKLDYEQLKAKVKLMANVHVERITPKPMEVDEMRREEWEWEQEEEHHEGSGIMAVGETCHRCGGVGHYARECGTSKGKGKDQTKGKGKAWGVRGRAGRWGARRRAGQG